jgi:hypothetical protein
MASFAPILRSPQLSVLDVAPFATPAVETFVRPCLGTKPTISEQTLTGSMHSQVFLPGTLPIFGLDVGSFCETIKSPRDFILYNAATPLEKRKFLYNQVNTPSPPL